MHNTARIALNSVQYGPSDGTTVLIFDLAVDLAFTEPLNRPHGGLTLLQLVSANIALRPGHRCCHAVSGADHDVALVLTRTCVGSLAKTALERMHQPRHIDSCAIFAAFGTGQFYMAGGGSAHGSTQPVGTSCTASADGNIIKS
jgi:hypothetical protein